MTRRAQSVSALALSRNFVNAKERRSIGSRRSSLAGDQQLIKALTEPGTHRSGQISDALEMIVERPLGNACCLDDGIHRERLVRTPSKERRACFHDLRTRSRPLLTP